MAKAVKIPAGYSDATPFLDRRHNFGWLADLLACVDEAALRPDEDQPDWRPHWTAGIQLGRDLVRVPRASLPRRATVFKGPIEHKVRRLEQALDHAAIVTFPWTVRRGWSQRRNEVWNARYNVCLLLPRSVTRIYTNACPTLPEWADYRREGLDAILALPGDHGTIPQIDAAWRWRDITNRAHRSPTIYAAFAAAWQIGAYQIAIDLATR